MTYLEQLEIIKTINVREGDTVVIQCPFCGGYKKLAVSKIDGQLKWFCYRASCNGRGIYQGRRSLQASKDYLAKLAKTTAKVKPLPEITTSVDNHKPAIDFLKSVNSLEAYQNGWIDVRYAPAEDRVMFYADRGAVGRCLKPYGPKWMTYGIIEGGVHVGQGSKAVLVEDVPSACSVSRLEGCVGVALLGTNITQSIKISIRQYTDCYLILDKDASMKAISEVRCTSKAIKVRLTKEDLKWLSTVEIKNLLQ